MAVLNLLLYWTARICFPLVTPKILHCIRTRIVSHPMIVIAWVCFVRSTSVSYKMLLFNDKWLCYLSFRRPAEYTPFSCLVQPWHIRSAVRVCVRHILAMRFFWNQKSRVKYYDIISIISSHSITLNTGIRITIIKH